MSFDFLIEKIVRMQNPTVVGLDPLLSYIPRYIVEASVSEFGETFEAAADAILKFNMGIIDEIYDIVPAAKMQCAYYEQMSWQGMRILEKTIQYARSKGMYVIVDGKRNDIGSTSEAYAAAFLGKTAVGTKSWRAFSGDALTVNGYLGSDGIHPFTEQCRKYDKSVFVLVKTSNLSSGEFQDKLLEGKPLYAVMGKMCERWGEGSIGKYGYSCVGAVVGATYPQHLQELRTSMPTTFLLVPAYGFQGGNGEDVAHAFDKNGLGAVVNTSRNIMTAYQKQNLPDTLFAKAAREEAIKTQNDILQYVKCIRFPK